MGLTATSVTAAAATLNLSNWTSAWWHNKTSGPGSASCTRVASGTATASLASLTVNSSYTWTVYSAANCNASDEIADLTFSTLPAKPGYAYGTAGNGKVRLGWAKPTSVTGITWQYAQKSGANDFGDWADITATERSGDLT